MSRLKTITFSTDSGGEQTLKVQDYDQGSEYEYYGNPADEALDASLRQNVRDERLSFSVKYKLSDEPDTFRSILNNIATDLQNGLSFFYVGIDSDNLFRVVLDGDQLYRIQYALQHGLFVPRLNMKALDLGGIDAITIEFEDWRFVDEAVTEQRDYGLITEAVTTSIDYGSIV